MLIVIVIAGILATITLNLNRSRIHQMQALDERQQRIDRHNNLNRELTNTNYIEWKKIKQFAISYNNGASTATGEWYSEIPSKNGKEINPIVINYRNFKHHNFSWSLHIIKKPINLWCEIISNIPTSSPNPSQSLSNISQITLIDTKSQESFCFQLNTALCQRSKC